jgi:hypothetical protein
VKIPRPPEAGKLAGKICELSPAFQFGFSRGYADADWLE